MAKIASRKDAVRGPEQAKTWGRVSRPVPIDLEGALDSEITHGVLLMTMISVLNEL